MVFPALPRVWCRSVLLGTPGSHGTHKMGLSCSQLRCKTQDGKHEVLLSEKLFLWELIFGIHRYQHLAAEQILSEIMYSMKNVKDSLAYLEDPVKAAFSVKNTYTVIFCVTNHAIGQNVPVREPHPGNLEFSF